MYHSDTPIIILFIFALVVPHKAFDKGFSKSFGVTVTFPSSKETNTSSCISAFKVQSGPDTSITLSRILASTFGANTTGNLPILDIILFFSI